MYFMVLNGFSGLEPGQGSGLFPDWGPGRGTVCATVKGVPGNLLCCRAISGEDLYCRL